MNNDTARDFQEIQNELGCGDTAAAMLVLADAVRESVTFDRLSAENFGHELALALKNVLQESEIRVVSNNL
jgi:hypothetical protein